MIIYKCIKSLLLTYSPPKSNNSNIKTRRVEIEMSFTGIYIYKYMRIKYDY